MGVVSGIHRCKCCKPMGVSTVYAGNRIPEGKYRAFLCPIDDWWYYSLVSEGGHLYCAETCAAAVAS